MYLPQAPTSAQRWLYLESGRLKLYIVSSLSTFILAIGMILFVKENTSLWPYTIFAGLTIFYLLLTYFVGFLGKDFDYKTHEKLVVKYLSGFVEGTTIDIYLPVCGEPMEVLKQTWSYVKNLKLNNPELVIEVYVLDDGKSDVVKKAAELAKFNYIRREGNELKKAGNMRHAFGLTKGEYIAIFDADFCPSDRFFINTLPYMKEYQDVGIVQTPQFFEYDDSQTPVQKGSGAIQELFYRLIQVNRDTFGGAICVGSNALYRRSMLEPFGGTAAIGYSEDVRTGFRMLAHGFKVKYLPINLAMGTCPETWQQFFTQNYRWAMGSIDLMFSKEFWKAKITFMQRLCYLTGMFYYTTTGLSTVFAFVPSLYLLAFKPEYVFAFNLIWSVPSLILTNLYMRYWQNVKFTWHCIQCRQVSYYAYLFALVDNLRNSTEEWIPTGGGGSSVRFKTFSSFVYFHNLLLGTLLLCLILLRVPEISLVHVIPVMLLFIYHIAALKPVLK